jgi:hypothetical protein
MAEFRSAWRKDDGSAGKCLGSPPQIFCNQLVAADAEPWAESFRLQACFFDRERDCRLFALDGGLVLSGIVSCR